MSDDLQQRVYPEDERLREVQEDPDRRMTRDQWEREESLARQASHKRHDSVQHDREVQQEFDRKKKSQHRNWGKLLLWIGLGILVLLLIFVIGYLPHRAHEKQAEAAAKQREQEEPEVTVIEVKRSHAPGELTVPGTTSPLTEAYIYARANGYVRKRYVDIGDHVKKGQLLASTGRSRSGSASGAGTATTAPVSGGRSAAAGAARPAAGHLGALAHAGREGCVLATGRRPA